MSRVVFSYKHYVYITLKSSENKDNCDSAGLDDITLCVYNLEIQ